MKSPPINNNKNQTTEKHNMPTKDELMVQALEILSHNLDDVDTSFPVLKAGKIRVQVTDGRLDYNKAGDKLMAVFVLATTAIEQNDKGEDIQPGFKLTERIVITPSEKRDADRVDQDLKRIKLALSTEGGDLGDPATYINEEVDITVAIEDTEGFGKQNRIKRWHPKAA